MWKRCRHLDRFTLTHNKTDQTQSENGFQCKSDEIDEHGADSGDQLKMPQPVENWHRTWRMHFAFHRGCCMRPAIVFMQRVFTHRHRLIDRSIDKMEIGKCTHLTATGTDAFATHFRTEDWRPMRFAIHRVKLGDTILILPYVLDLHVRNRCFLLVQFFSLLTRSWINKRPARTNTCDVNACYGWMAELGSYRWPFVCSKHIWFIWI